MPSLFTRLYAQRPGPERNQLENFLTEAFAFALEKDPVFRNRWIRSLQCFNAPKEIGDCLVNTQTSYLDGQPDIELCGSDFKIIVESKVDSPEGIKQLDRYSSILSKPEPGTGKIYAESKQVLVYLTRHNEHKKKPKAFKGHFICYRWFQVHDLIQNSDVSFTQELKQFLKDLNMAVNDNFNYHDLNALLTIHGTIRKMDAALNAVRQIGIKELGAAFSPSTRSTALQRDLAYYNNAFYKYSHIDLGFVWWKGDGEIYLYAAHFVHKKTEAEFGSHDIVKALSENDHWIYWGEHKDYHGWEKTKPLSQILVDGGNQIQHISEWFAQRLHEWKSMKEQVPRFFDLIKGTTEALP